MNDFFVGVPFTGFEEQFKNDYVMATREDEAIGIAVGAWLAGKSPLVFMQNSGFGNCLDIMTSLLKIYEINIDLLICNRQDLHHKHMGEILTNIMELMKYETVSYC